MLTVDALLIISEYRDRHAAELTQAEFEAAGIAMVILGSLAPAERALVDRLSFLPEPSIN